MSYTRVNWQNSPNTSTPLSAENLNKMDAGIKRNADDIETLQQHTYDTELNSTSTNAPQTKTVYEELQRINIETDPTLTVSGKAADAAATGEAVANVKSAIDALKIVDTANGAIASFPDGAAMPVEGLTVELEPIQDLHGQDAPYPAGGGKNKVDIADFTVTSQYYGDYVTLDANTYTLSLNVKNSTDISGTAYFKTRSGTNLVVKTIPANENDRVSGTFTLSEQTDVRFTASGSTSGYNYSFTNIMVELGSTATDFAPYSNICPITGRDAVTVVRYNGKNVFNPNANPSKWIDANGNIISSDANSSVSDKIYVNSSITQACIYIRTTDAEGVLLIAAYDRNDKLLLRKAGSGTRYVSMESIPQDTHYLLFAKYRTAPPVCGVLNTLSNSPFYEYTDDALLTVTISLGQTVYGGTVDVTTGVMTVDRAIVDLGTLDWIIRNFGTQSGFASYELPGGKSIPGNNGIMEQAVCSIYKIGTNGSLSVASNDIIAAVGAYYASGCNIYVRDSRFTDVATFKTAMQGEQLVYELATPLEITLDPATLSTLKGTNNVWSDADSVSVEYVADPKLYIARLTEPDADMVADANITSGQYFMVGNTLYLATANIASGANIVPGVNCTKTNLAAALNAINA